MKPVDLARPTRVTLVTGEMAAPFVRALAEKLEMGQNVRVEVCVVPNRFFGETVTTAGLLMGREVLAALQERGAGDIVILPATAIREGEGFLDGMTVEELAMEMKTQVLVAHTPREAARGLKKSHR
jgi:NifB/MoaA-like Fe-S oxidoreductase